MALNVIRREQLAATGGNGPERLTNSEFAVEDLIGGMTFFDEFSRRWEGVESPTTEARVSAATGAEDRVHVCARLVNVLSLSQELERRVLKKIFGFLGRDAVAVVGEADQLLPLMRVKQHSLDNLSSSLGCFGGHRDLNRF